MSIGYVIGKIADKNNSVYSVKRIRKTKSTKNDMDRVFVLADEIGLIVRKARIKVMSINFLLPHFMNCPHPP